MLGTAFAAFSFPHLISNAFAENGSKSLVFLGRLVVTIDSVLSSFHTIKDHADFLCFSSVGF